MFKGSNAPSERHVAEVFPASGSHQELKIVFGPKREILVVLFGGFCLPNLFTMAFSLSLMTVYAELEIG